MRGNRSAAVTGTGGSGKGEGGVKEEVGEEHTLTTKSGEHRKGVGLSVGK